MIDVGENDLSDGVAVKEILTLGDSEGIDDFVVVFGGVHEGVIVVVRFKGVCLSQSCAEFARLECRAELFAQV